MFEHEELKPDDGLFDTEDAKFSVCQPTRDSLQENGSISTCNNALGIETENKRFVYSLQVSCCFHMFDISVCPSAAGLKKKHHRFFQCWLYRPCTRRQSARFKSEEPKPSEDFFEIQDATFSSCSLRDDRVQEDGLTSTSSFKNEEKEEGISAPVFQAQGSRRSSLSRPSRQAARKVQTYKEIPLNIKMRRTE